MTSPTFTPEQDMAAALRARGWTVAPPDCTEPTIAEKLIEAFYRLRFVALEIGVDLPLGVVMEDWTREKLRRAIMRNRTFFDMMQSEIADPDGMQPGAFIAMRNPATTMTLAGIQILERREIKS